MKIRPERGTDLFHVDRRTDRHDETNICFSKLCKRANTSYCRYANLTSKFTKILLIILKFEIFELNVCHMPCTTKRQVMYRCHISLLSVKEALQGQTKTFIRELVFEPFRCITLALQFRFPEVVTKEVSLDSVLRSMSLKSNFDGRS
jgi:hypothetical protein